MSGERPDSLVFFEEGFCLLRHHMVEQHGHDRIFDESIEVLERKFEQVVVHLFDAR
jgi:hypothetical protein